MVTLQQVLERVREPKREGAGYVAFCPAHRDGEKNRRRSLSIVERDGKLLVHCFAGCSFDSVMAALGLGGNGSTPKKPEKPEKKIVAQYDYTDADGQLIAQIVRYAPKNFVIRRPDGRGGWIWNGDELPPLLYHLREMLESANDGRTVLVVEGEKAADAAANVGLVAVTSAFGAGKWTPEHAAYFPEGTTVGILPDNDGPGRAHAELVARTLTARGCDARIVELPGLPEKGDICEYLEAGGTRDDVLMMVDKAATWKPTELDAEREEKKAPRRFQMHGVDEILAWPAPSWAVDGVLLDGGFSVLFGPAGQFKSFLALDLGLHLAAGRSWHCRNVEQGGVIYVCAEGSAGLGRRIAAWLQHHGLDASAVAGFKVVTEPVVPFADAATFIEAVKAQAEPGGLPLRLVILDTLSRCFVGGDENSSADMCRFVAGLDAIRAQLETGVLVLHHSGKDLTKGERGSTALRGAADAMLRIEKLADAAGPVPGLCTLTFDKTKDFENPRPLDAELRQVVVEGLGSSLVVTGIQDTPAARVRRDTATEDRRARVLTHVKNAPEPLTITAIESLVSGRRDNLRSDLAALTATGELKTGTKKVKGREVCTWQA